MPALELRDVAVKVLRADVVEGSHDAPVKQGPKTLNPVGMGLLSNVLPRAVLDRYVSP